MPFVMSRGWVSAEPAVADPAAWAVLSGDHRSAVQQVVSELRPSQAYCSTQGADDFRFQLQQHWQQCSTLRLAAVNNTRKSVRVDTRDRISSDIGVRVHTATQPNRITLRVAAS